MYYLFPNRPAFNVWHRAVCESLRLPPGVAYTDGHKSLAGDAIYCIVDRRLPKQFETQTAVTRARLEFLGHVAVDQAESIVRAKKLDDLYNACRAYQDQYVDANGMQVVNELIAAGITEAVAVRRWRNQLWNEYYARRAQLTEYGFDVSNDFKVAGVPVPSFKQLVSDHAQLFG